MIHSNPENTLGQPTTHTGRLTALALVISVSVVAASFLWQGRYGFNIGDEGFLWYGAQRVMLGEVPIRDFMAYEPGRYYWSAALMTALGDNGILALRIAVAVFQAMGLFVGLRLLLANPRLSVALCVLATVTLLVWMYPRHKLFDISLSIILVGLLTWVLQRPSRLRFFLSGAAVGLISVFGRNHGLYGLIGMAGVFAYLLLQKATFAALVRLGLSFALGVLVGFSPLLLMAALIPGFATAFWATIVFMFDHGATNLPLPVPWPWLVPIGKLVFATAATDILIGVFFVALLVFPVCGSLWILRSAAQNRTVQPAFVAATALAIPYAHFAYSRADVGHLAQGIFPLLIGVFVILLQLPRWPRFVSGTTLAACSFYVMIPLHPYWDCRASAGCAAINIAGTTLYADANMRAIVTKLQDVTQQYAGDRNVLIMPLWPGAYPLLGRKSPVHEIYALFPRSAAFQRAEIERIQAAKPSFVFILNVALDQREELRFSNSHAEIDNFVRENYEAVPQPDWPPDIYQFYRLKGS